VALALALTLTGCGRFDAQPDTGSDASTGAVGTSATTPPPADDSTTLDGISQDLDSAGTANTEAGSNAQAGDQAGASGDEP
jgi:hypothetical protein